MLGLVIKSEPGIIVVGGEHMAVLDAAGEVVMAVDVHVAVDLYEPGATAGAAGHIAGNGDHRAAPHLPAFAGGRRAGLPGLTIERRRGRVAIGVEGLIDRLIIGQTRAADHVGQVTLAIGRNDSHDKVAMQVALPGTYPFRRNFQVARSPTAIRRAALIVERAEDHILHPVTIPVEAVTSRINHIMVEAYHGSAGADHVLTGGVGKKDLPNGGERISRISVEWGLPILPGRLARVDVGVRLRKIDAIAGIVNQLIAIDGAAHSIFCPVAYDNGGIRIHLVYADRLRNTCNTCHPGVYITPKHNQVHHVHNGKQTKEDFAGWGPLDGSKLSWHYASLFQQAWRALLD